jgi:hypothetical protein
MTGLPVTVPTASLLDLLRRADAERGLASNEPGD